MNVRIILFLAVRFLLRSFDFLWKVKLGIARIYVGIVKWKTPPTYDFKFETKDVARHGITSLPKTWLKEKPRALEPNTNAFDGLGFMGINKDGGVLVTRITRRHNRISETWVYLRLPSGDEYHLPIQPDTKICNVKENSFSAGGLTFELLEPLRRWRVSFNGYLRKGKHNDHVNNENNIILVRFNFVWQPIYSYLSFPDDFSSSFLAKITAKQDWIKGIGCPKKLFSQEFDEQFGQLHGIVCIEGENEQQLLLRGLRKRNYGVHDWKTLENGISISGTLNNGISFHIFGERRKEGPIKNFLYGYVLNNCNMLIHHIDTFSLDEDSLFNFKSFPQELSIKLKAGKREFNLELLRNKSGYSVNEGDECNTAIDLKTLTLKMNGNEGQGIMEYSHPIEGNRLPQVRASLPLLKEPDIKNCSSFVVRFNDLACHSSNIVGGKGASLSNMATIQYKLEDFSVPDGVCLTKTAFEVHMRHNYHARAAILEMQNVAWKRKDGSLSDECDKVVKLISQSIVPKEVKIELHSMLMSAFGDNFESLKFAIRSSAIVGSQVL